jgi:hypothetical protein
MSDKTYYNQSSIADLKTKGVKVLDGIIDILKLHTGPYAASALISSKYRQNNDVEEFTKDGIRILTSLYSSECPVERSLSRMCRFVGHAVDQRCGDGTTTSMLFLALSMRHILNGLDENIIGTKNIARSIQLAETLKSIWQEFEKTKITIDDLEELIGTMDLAGEYSREDIKYAVAWNMAMVSSKGNRDLSEKIATVVSSLPEKGGRVFKVRPETTEISDPFILKQVPYDFILEGRCESHYDLNHQSGTQMLSEDCVLYMAEQVIADSSLEELFLTELIVGDDPATMQDLGGMTPWKKLNEGLTRDLVILAPSFQSSRLNQVIDTYNQQTKGGRIIRIQFHARPRLLYSVVSAIKAVAGAGKFERNFTQSASDLLIGLDGGVSVFQHGGTVELSGLYHRDGGSNHPFLNSPDHPFYNAVVDEMLDTIQKCQNDPVNPPLDPEDLAHLTDLYRHTTTQKLYEITLGGTRHEQASNLTVFQDAITAATSAVFDGFVLSGYDHMLGIINGRVEKSDPTHVIHDLQTTLVEILMAATRAPLPLTTDSFSKFVYRISRLKDDEAVIQKGDLANPDVMKGFLDCDGEHVLIQAFIGYDEQFRRFKDILPKLANTGQIIDMRNRDAKPDNQ